MEKDFQICSPLLHRTWGTSAASVRSSAAAKGAQGVCGGAEEIGVGFHQWSVAGSEPREDDCVRSVSSGHEILGPGEPAIHRVFAEGV